MIAMISLHYITGDRDQEALEQTGETAGFKKDLNDDIGRDHDREGNKASSLLFVSEQGE